MAGGKIFSTVMSLSFGRHSSSVDVLTVIQYHLLMGINDLLNYCRINTERKWETAQSLYKTKRYSDCLFFCHLTLEFLLKGLVVDRTRSVYPYTHDLVDLAKRAGLDLDKMQRNHLETINTFNMAGRYDDYKSTFYKKATSAYTEKYFQITKDLLLWLKNS